ncbi:MAG TPA: glycoside hydrolase family 73 protein [Clostridium sp.]|uniref:glycoside hydrolase family 73 protein n=1 Tax=Clostridium sp. TaxID=1506 RepID=UPI002F95A6ED
MNSRIIYIIFKGLKNEKTRGVIISISLSFFFLIFIPIAYFYINNPVVLGITAVKNAIDGSNVQLIKANMTQQQFFNNVSGGAIKTYKKDGIFASITLAQAMLESGTGSSGLTSKANNLFGVKAYDWTGKTVQMMTKEHVQGIDIYVLAPFRAYDNWNDSIEDHADFLIQNSTYTQNGVFTSKTYAEQAQALQNAGYATDPNYAISLVILIKQYNLDKYDRK